MTSTLSVRFGEFELNEADARLRRNGLPVALPPKAFGVLCALVRQPGTLVSKNTLLDTVWGHQHVSESVLKTVISQVRSALDDDASSPRFVETASRLGYRFIGAMVTEANRAASMAAPALKDALVGRDAELTKLHAGWERARRGRHTLMWIAGDAGIGKSTLVEAFVFRSGAATIAQGQCVEQHGAGEPYLPVLQALGDLCRTYPQLIVLMRSCAPTWLLQLPWLLNESERGSLARELAGTGSERMLREFQELMVRFTVQSPLLFVIEDLHWADTATLKLMDHFARQRQGTHVLWVATFRLTQIIAEDHPLQRVRQELRMHRLADEIALECFSESEVQKYLQSREVSISSSEDFVRRVHTHTDGLPLFVANVVEALDAQVSGTALSAPLPVPESLLDAVETRISLLPSGVVAILEAAAVCGLNFSARVVASMTGDSYDEVSAACDRLARQQYWLRHSATLDLADGSLDAQYGFRHAIYRHTFYLRISETQRALLHRRCARALAEAERFGIESTPAEIAYHHAHGHEAGAAVRAYTLAGRHSLRSFSPRTAQEHCEKAHQLLPSLPDLAERRLLELDLETTRGAAAAALHGVGSDQSRAVYERVRELCELLPQHPARIALLSGYGGSLVARAEYARLDALAEELERSHPDDQSIFSYFGFLYRAWAASARGECRVATDWWLKAIKFCEEIRDRRAYESFIMDPEVGARANSSRTLFERGLFDRARMEAASAINRAQQTRIPLSRAQAHWRAGILEIRLENPPAVLKHAEAVREIAETSSASHGDGIARYLRGWAVARLGDPKLGLQLIRDGLAQQLQVGVIANCTEVMAYAAEAMILARDWSGADQELAGAFDRAGQLGEWVYGPMLLLLQSRVARGRGDMESAVTLLREAIKTARRQEAPGFELKAACELAETPGSVTEAHAALKAVLNSLPGCRDTPDTLRARSLLA